MQWIGKLVARLREEKRVSLRKEKERSHKLTLNTLIVGNKDIMRGTAIRNLNRTEQLK